MKDMKIIKELMEQLIEEMEMTPDSLDDRLGRKKPDLEVIKIEGEMDPFKKSDDDDDDDDMEELEVDGEEEEPEEEADDDDIFRKRLLKLRK